MPKLRLTKLGDSCQTLIPNHEAQSRIITQTKKPVESLDRSLPPLIYPLTA
jgi:hypothetical protein